jgi:PleD family two-component response regulator
VRSTKAKDFEMNVRILLATPNSEELLFLGEVLEDIQTDRHWHGWVRIEPLHAMSMEDAVSLLIEEPVDAVVLDLMLCGDRAADGFRRLQATAPHVPVVLLARPQDREIAVHLMREGAQDFLLSPQVDAAPLAHALGNAMERHRLLSGARAARTTDPLTGLLNRSAFFSLAERDRRLAEKLGCRLMVVVAEPRDNQPAACGTTQGRDLLLISTAEWLHRLAGPTDVVARLGETRFAMSVFDSAAESLEAAWSRIHTSAQESGTAIGASIFDCAHPSPLEMLIERAERDLAPKAMAVRI